MTMYDKWFDEHVYDAVVRKAYVPNEVLKVLQEEPVELPPYNPLNSGLWRVEWRRTPDVVTAAVCAAKNRREGRGQPRTGRVHRYRGDFTCLPANGGRRRLCALPLRRLLFPQIPLGALLCQQEANDCEAQKH